MQVGKAKGALKNFLIEPFVPHSQVKREKKTPKLYILLLNVYYGVVIFAYI